MPVRSDIQSIGERFAPSLISGLVMTAIVVMMSYGALRDPQNRQVMIKLCVGLGIVVFALVMLFVCALAHTAGQSKRLPIGDGAVNGQK